MRVATRRSSQSGSVMILVMVMLVALLAGAGVMLSLQSSSNRQVGVTSRARAALFCAEAGLADARVAVGGNYDIWSDILDGDTSNDPDWYPLTRDIDDPPDGVPDYLVTVHDNDDEPEGTPNDLTVDFDRRVFVVSKCTKFADYPKEVVELLMYAEGTTGYRNQSGQGAGNTGNAN